MSKSSSSSFMDPSRNWPKNGVLVPIRISSLRSAWGELGPNEEAILEAHLGACPHCEELVRRLNSTGVNVDESKWRKIESDLDRKPSPWRQAHRFGLRASTWKSLGAVAASLVLVTVSGWWISSQMRTSRQTPASTLRGSVLQIRNPRGRVERIESFRWDAPPLEVVYRLEIKQGEQPVWEATTSATR